MIIMCFSTELEKMNIVGDCFGARVDDVAFNKFIEFRKRYPDDFKTVGEDLRIYPNYFGYIIVKDNKQNRIIRPARYQLLPHFSKNSKYIRVNSETGREVQVSTFNARVDSLEKRYAWKKIFGKNHCLVVHKKFYEYVKNDETGKSSLISFKGKGYPLLWSAGLWDRWESPDRKFFIDSYAIITTNPVQIIEEAVMIVCQV